MIEKFYNILSTTILVLSLITATLFFVSPYHNYFIINLFFLLITFFISFTSRKNIFSNQTLTVESKFLMATMIIEIIQYCFGVFFILGRLFVENFIR